MNIRDVAAAAGVSVATVSRVISPKSADQSIRPATRQRVLEAIDKLGYRPNDLARALLQQRTSTVGLVVPDISNPYYPALVRGLEDTAWARGYRVVLCNTDRNVEKTTAYLDTLVKTRVDGIIIAGGSTTVPMLRDVLQPYRTKVVVVGRHELGYPSVRVDNVAAVRDAVAYLIGLGHRGIGFLGGPLGSSTVQDRLAGYREALRDTGIECRDEFVREGDFQEQSGYDAARSLIESPGRPTALMAANDRMAVGAMAAIADAGLRVPEDVSLIGFDDVSLASYIRPALSTVSVPTYEMGSAAMELLLQEFDDTAEGVRTDSRALSTSLVIRDTCAPPP